MSNMNNTSVHQIDCLDFHLVKWLDNGKIGESIGTVHSVFDKVINFISIDSLTLFTLALSEVIQSPKMMRTCDSKSFSYTKSSLYPSKEIYLMSYRLLKIGPFLWDFSEAKIWERDLTSLSSNPKVTNNQLEKLNDFIYTNGADSGLLTAWTYDTYPDLRDSINSKNLYFPSFLQSLQSLNQAIRKKKIMESTCNMAGLGMGLTPSMDDFLTGLFATWDYFDFPLFRIEKKKKVYWLQKIKGKTTDISYFMLKHCLNGYVNDALLELLENLGSESTHGLEEVLKIGSTSGTDMLTGVSLDRKSVV